MNSLSSLPQLPPGIPRVGRRRFSDDASAIALIEFAVVAPFMLLLMLGGFDLGRYVIATERIEVVANSMAQMISISMPRNGNADGQVSGWAMNEIENIAYFIYPDFLSQQCALTHGWWDCLDFEETMVKMTPSGKNAAGNVTYTPSIVWIDGTSHRKCGDTLGFQDDSLPPDPSKLPNSVNGPSAIIVVDIHFTFVPTFGSSFLGNVPISRSAFLPLRYVPMIDPIDNKMGLHTC